MERIEKIFGARLPDYKELLEQNLSLRRVVTDLTGMLSKREQELHNLVPALNDFRLVFEAKIDTILKDFANLTVNKDFDQPSLKDISFKLRDLKMQEEKIMARILESEENLRFLFDASLDYSRSIISSGDHNSSIQGDRSVYFDTLDLNVSDIPKTDARKDSKDESGFGDSNNFVKFPMNSTRLVEENSQPLPKTSPRAIGKNAEDKKSGPETERNIKESEKELKQLWELVIKQIEGLKTTNVGLLEKVEEALEVGQKILDRINSDHPQKEAHKTSAADADVAKEAGTSNEHKPNSKVAPKIVILEEDFNQKQVAEKSRRKKERVPSFKSATNSSNTNVTDQSKTRAKSPSCPCKIGCRTRSCTCRENKQSCDDCDCDPSLCTNRSSDEQASVQSIKSNNTAKSNKSH